MQNDAGLKAEFYNCESEAGEKVLVTIVRPHEKHQSYPHRMHGGVISALLDESIGRAVQVEHPEIWAVTIDMSIKFRKPVPLDKTIYIESRVTNLTNRAFTGTGRMFTNDGVTLATSEAKYLIMPYQKIFESEHLTDFNWFLSDKKLPKFIKIETKI